MIFLWVTIVQCKSISKEITSFTSRNMVLACTQNTAQMLHILKKGNKKLRSLGIKFIYSFLLSFNKHLLSYYYVWILKSNWKNGGYFAWEREDICLCSNIWKNYVWKKNQIKSEQLQRADLGSKERDFREVECKEFANNELFNNHCG